MTPPSTTTPPSAIPLSPATSALRPPPTPFRAILWKELHESLKYAVASAVLFLVPTLVALYSVTDGFNRYSNNLANLIFLPIFGGTCAFLCPAVGLLLGVLQILHDHPADRGAFLLHRPITPTALFLAKTTAGAILYFLAAGLPALLFILYCAVSPNAGLVFSWHFALPQLADFLSGFAWYFTGLLITQRQARWYASRFWPVAAALLASLAVQNLPLFSQAVLACLPIIALLALSAWGAYIARGLDDALPTPARITLPIVILLGLTLLFAPLSFAFAEGTRRLVLDAYRQPASPVRLSFESTDYAMLPDGTPTRIHHGYTREGGTYRDTIVRYTDPQDNPLPPSAATQSALTYNRSIRVGWATSRPTTSYREPVSLVTSFTASNPDPDAPKGEYQRWFYVTPWRYFVGYHMPDRQPVGTLGVNGFAPPSASPVPFPKSPLELKPVQPEPLGSGTLVLDHAAYRPDFWNHVFTPFFTVPPDETIRQFSYENLPNYLEVFAVATDRNIRLLDPTGRPLLTVPFENPFPTHGASLYFFPAEQRYVIEYSGPKQVGPSEYSSLEYTSTFTMDGQLVGHKNVEIPRKTSPVDNNLVTAERLSGVLAGAIVSFSNVFIALVTMPVFAYTASPADLRQALGVLLSTPYLYFHLLGYLLLALPAALLTSLLTRRYPPPIFSRTARILWPLFTLLLGPLVLLTFLFTQTLPRRTPCPHCRRLRPLTLPECPHCAAPFPAPAPNNTEIFA